MSIVFPHILPFPLYHGTSSIWQSSIETHGLGGRDIVQEFRAVECLKAAIGLLKRLPDGVRPDEWDIKRYEELASQDVVGLANFRHGGGVYLTPSRQTAFNYSRYELGSEVISECYFLCNKYNLELLPQEYRDLFSLDPSGLPLIVRVHDVKTKDLRSEHDGDYPAYLDLLLEQYEEAKKNEQRGIGREMSVEETLDVYGQQVIFNQR